MKTLKEELEDRIEDELDDLMEAQYPDSDIQDIMLDLLKDYESEVDSEELLEHAIDFFDEREGWIIREWFTRRDGYFPENGYRFYGHEDVDRIERCIPEHLRTGILDNVKADDWVEVRAGNVDYMNHMKPSKRVKCLMNETIRKLLEGWAIYHGCSFEVGVNETPKEFIKRALGVIFEQDQKESQRFQEYSQRRLSR